MDREGIKELLREVLGPNTQLVDHPKWVGLHCPLAEWTHARGTDSTPSAGVSVNPDGTSIYHCYSCLQRQKGPLSWFLKEYERYTGQNLAKIIREIDTNEFLGGSLPEWGVKDMASRKPVKVLDPKVYDDLFDSAEGHPYLKRRGISDRTVRELGIALDEADTAGDERIVFPVRMPNGDLVGFTGRATEKGVEPRIRDYYGLPKEKVLLGAHLVNKEDPYLIVVEGLFDYARVWEHGFPVVAALHAGLTPHQVKLLEDLGKPVVLMFDPDEAGIHAMDTCSNLLKNKLPVSRVRYYKRIVGGKRKWPDPGEMAEEEVEDLVGKAEIV